MRHRGSARTVREKVIDAICSASERIRNQQVAEFLLLFIVLTCSCQSNRTQNYDFALPQVRGGTFHLRSEASAPVLLAFLQTVPDTVDTPSRRQVVFLTSMAHQYGPRGLKVVVVDASGLVSPQKPDHKALVNASYDWQMDFPLLEDPDNRVARRFGVTQVPTQVLLAPDGTIAQRWPGSTGPAMLAQGIERILGGPLGRLPTL